MQKDKYYGQAVRIATWKRNSLLENWLSKLADRSEGWKRLYVAYYKIADREYFQNGIKMIDKQTKNDPRTGGPHVQGLRFLSGDHSVLSVVKSVPFGSRPETYVIRFHFQIRRCCCPYRKPYSPPSRLFPFRQQTVPLRWPHLRSLW